MLLPTPPSPRPLTRLLAVLALCSGSAALAQREPSPAPVQTVQASDLNKTTDLKEIIISAPKLSKSLLEAPLSATVTTGRTIDENAINTVKDAAFHTPNVFFTEFTARKLSNPRFRGIGASPFNPGVTTYYDGVPQFNGNSSSITLLDVAQIDFIRGPAGALFGRNTVGGLINVTSNRPSLDAWHGSLETTQGSYDFMDYRGSITGPLIQDSLGFSFAGGYQSRDGYTCNTQTGNDLDGRDAWFGKTQFLWTPSDNLEVRLILAGERARDGDYALNDLNQLRQTPRRSSRDLEGYTQRDVLMPTLQVTYHAGSFDFTSTTGLVWWRTEDLTDLDYTSGPNGFYLGGAGTYLFRQNREQQSTWTQEFRFSNPTDKPVVLSPVASLGWQAGLFLFYQQYDQQTRQQVAPLFGGFVPRAETRTNTGLRDMGFGLYLQSTLTLWDRLDLTAGVRLDHEDKEADLITGRDVVVPGVYPFIDSVRSLESSFTQVTPQAAASFKITPDHLAYFTFSGGYKAGGFNTAANGGIPAYDQERSWNYELGFKGRVLDNKLNYNLAFYYTDWRNLQLNTPSANSPAQFDITNAGNATTKGIEFALNYRPVAGWDLFGSVAWQDAKFRSGAMDNDSRGLAPAPTNISGNRLPFAPDYTASFGTQFTVEIGGGWNAYARAEIQNIGTFFYDSINGAAQDSYTLANFRLGVRNQNWFVESFVNNAFDTEYVPMALQFGGGVVPSGYIGESGAPLTFGVRTGLKF